MTFFLPWSSCLTLSNFPWFPPFVEKKVTPLKWSSVSVHLKGLEKLQIFLHDIHFVSINTDEHTLIKKNMRQEKRSRLVSDT